MTPSKRRRAAEAVDRAANDVLVAADALDIVAGDFVVIGPDCPTAADRWYALKLCARVRRALGRAERMIAKLEVERFTGRR